MAAPLPLPDLNLALSDRVDQRARSEAGLGDYGVGGVNIGGASTGGAGGSASGANPSTRGALGLPSGANHWVNYALIGVVVFVAIKLLKKK